MRSAALALLVFLVPHLATADVPPVLSVQGVLRTSSGAPAGGDYTLAVSLWSAQSGGTKLWDSVAPDVPAEAGVFDLELGPFNGASASLFATNADVWLQVGVEGEPPLPRRRVTTSAYAFQARNADTAADVVCTGCVQSADTGFSWAQGASKGGAAADLECSGCVQGGELADGAVSGAKIADGSVGSADLGFAYAGSAIKGGAAMDLACSGCVGGAELEANLILSGDVTVTGSLTACTTGGTCRLGVSGAGGLSAGGSGWLHLLSPAGVRVRSDDGSAWQQLQTGPLTATAATIQGSLTLGTAILSSQTTLQPFVEGAAGTRLLLRGTASGKSAALASDATIGFETHGAVRLNHVGATGLAADSGAAADEGRVRLLGGGANGAALSWRPPQASSRPRSLALETADGSGVLSPRLVVLSDGRVGVGTESPAQKLDVAGTIAASGELHIGAGGLRYNASSGKLEFSHDRETWAELGTGGGSGSGGGDGPSPFGSGGEGALVAAGTVYTDTVRTAVVGANPAGGATLSVASASGFAPGDEVLIITMQDAASAGALTGQMDTRTVASVNGSQLTFTEPLSRTFTQTSAVRHQAIRIPHWTDVTVSGTLTCHSWDGSTGGVLAFRASGTVSKTGSGRIDASGTGYRGLPTVNLSGQQWGALGEGVAGGYGLTDYKPTAGNNGGGGGGLNSAGSEGGGGGGGSLVVAGGTGNVWCGQPAGATHGQPGNTVSPSPSRPLMGGAGGRGTTGAGDCGTVGGGGNGGGVALIWAWYFNPIEIRSNGVAGGCSGQSLCGDYGIGGGGGGAGGSIVVKCGSGCWNVTPQATGGAGGISGHCDSTCAAGGIGGNGYVSLTSPPSGQGSDPNWGSGADGSVIVNGTVYTDAVRSPVAGNNGAGAMVIGVASATGFQAGDEVLIITMLDGAANGALVGQYETRTLAGVSGSSLTLTQALQNTYNQSSTRRHQVIRIPHWEDVTLAGGVLTAHAWDGDSGGVVAFRVNGTLSATGGGRVSADSIGYRGATGGDLNGQQWGRIGEGVSGGWNTQNYAPPAGSNGGGGGGLNSAGSEGGGGGGGSLGTAGAWGNVWCGNPAGSTRGQSGATAQVTATRWVMGGGGGAGSTGAGDCGHVYDAGAGGGIVAAFVKTVATVPLHARGANGGCGGTNLCGDYGIGGSGGGAGGTVYLLAGSGAGSASIALGGGTGGLGGHCDSTCASAGDGGTGVSIIAAP